MLTWRLEHGEGREFADGEDALWVLPGDPLGDCEPAEADALFADLDRRRSRVLDALRRHLAAGGLAVRRRGTGEWSVRGGSMPGTIDVGRRLTVLLRERGDLEALRMLARFFGGPDVDDEKLAGHLADESPPADLPWPGGDDDEDDEPTQTPAEALAASRTGRKGKLRSETHRRVAAAVDRMAGRLADVPATWELTTGGVHLDFADGYAHLPVPPARSRKLRRLVDRLGVEAAGDHLAGRYRRLDALRRRAIAAMFAVLRERGYGVDGGFGGASFGRDHREFQVDMQHRLTARLAKHGEAATLRAVLPPDLAEAAVARLGTADDMSDLPERDLPLRPPRRTLPDEPLTSEEVAAADEAAAAVWPRLVEAHATTWDPLWSPELPAAHGPPDWPERRAHFEENEPDIDMWGLDLLYARRHEEPALARRYLVDSGWDGTPFEDDLRAAGDPRAVRPVAAAVRRGDVDADLLGTLAFTHLPTLLAMLDDEDVARLRRTAARAAGGDDWRDAVRLGLRAGWPEVGGAFLANRRLVRWVSDVGETWGGRPEHPLTEAGDVVLAWSAVRPDARLARVLHGGLTTTPRDQRKTRPLRRREKLPVAVAWRRCRAAGV